MFVALKNSTKIPSIYLLVCNLNKKKCLIFVFTLSHTLTVFLSISSHELHFLTLKLSLVFLSQWSNGSLASALHSRPNGLCFLPFLLFSFSVSHTPETLPKKWHADFGSFASLFIKRSKTYPRMLSFALNQIADFVGLRRQAHK